MIAKGSLSGHDPVADSWMNANVASSDGERTGMPVWLWVLTALCGFVGLRSAWRRKESGDTPFGGAKANRLTIVLAVGIILVALGLMAAIQLGFVPDHAP